MLHLEHISVKAGRRGPLLLRGVSFHVAPGTLLAVLGANGAGKSTLLRAIGGELPVADGAIRWKGRRVQDIAPHAAAQERAFLDQHSAVPFAFTAREVVMMGRYPHFGTVPSQADEDAVDRALRAMHVEHYQHRAMPSLSGGERKRVHVARAITQLDNGRNDASLLLLDEPLNDLDVRHQHALMVHARAHAEAGHCVIVVLHDANMAARYAHRILLLKQGRAIAQGRPREVLSAPVLSDTYGMAAHVMPHPLSGTPWVHFGEAAPHDADERAATTHLAGVTEEA